MKLGSVVKDGKVLKVAKVVYRDDDHNLEVSFDPTQTQPSVPATGGVEEGEPVAAAMGRGGGGGGESEVATVATGGQEERRPPPVVKVQNKSQLPMRQKWKKVCTRIRVQDQEEDNDFMEPACQVKSKVAKKATQDHKKHKLSEQEPEDEVEEEDEDEYEDYVEDEDEDEEEDEDNDFMEPALKVKRKVPQNRKTEAMQGSKKKVASKQKMTKDVPPNAILEMVGSLNKPQRDRLHALGFDWVFKFRMNGLRSSELIEYLMDCLDPDSMCLDLGGRGKLPVTPDVVHCVLGLQNGHLDPPVVSDTAPLDPIREELGLGKKEKISSSSILDRIKMGGTDDFTMQCILMILFSKLLAPESSSDITGNIVNMVSKNLELYKDMALCKFVVDHLRWSAERWKSGKRSTVYGCTALLVVYYLDNLLCKAMISNTDTPRSQFFNSSLIDKIENLTKSTKKDGSTSFGKLNLRCRESTCYFVSKEKVKGKVGAASGSTRKRKHIDELAAQEATVARSKEAPHFGGDFPSLRSKLGPLVESLGSTCKQIGLDALEQYDKEVEQIMGNLHKAQDHLVNVLTSFCSTSDPKIAYTWKSKKRRDGLPPLDSHAVTDKTSGSGNENTTQASIGTPPTQANDVLGDEQSRGNVESSLPMHLEDPKDAEAGQPCEPAIDAHNDNDAELSNLVDKICTNVEGLVDKICTHVESTPTPAIAPSLAAKPSPVIMPIQMEKRRPLANPKYISPFKCVSTEPLWDDTVDNAMEVYKIVCNGQLPDVESAYLIDQMEGAIIGKGDELRNCFSEGGKLTNDIMLFWSTCSIYDDANYRKESIGYRVIIPTSAIEVLDSENHNLAFSFDAAVNIISRECKSFDLPNAKLVGRFLDVLNVMFPKKFTDVRKWKCYPACTQNQVLTNDCGFLAMKYIQLWDDKVFVKKVCPKDGTKYHAEALYYILFHPLNEAKLLRLLSDTGLRLRRSPSSSALLFFLSCLLELCT
uniref:Ubiquitin-like protease family profile domain-containing protein n=1 Tax=Oryza punctata TaxID=4537 RepID=A0A0E0LIX6_ORYPU